MGKQILLRSTSFQTDQRCSHSFETVKGVWLEVEPFPAHILTPTLKMKRYVAIRCLVQRGSMLISTFPLFQKTSRRSLQTADR